MAIWAERLGILGEVALFDYDGYGQVAGREFRRTPCTHPSDVAALTRIHLAAIERLVPPDRPYILAGKSMGAHIACHAAAALERRTGRPPVAIVTVAYPLRAALDKSIFRDSVLTSLRATPVFFIVGGDDALTRIDELDPVRAKMEVPTGLFVIPGLSHGMDLPRGQKIEGMSRIDWEKKAAKAAEEFISRLGNG